MSPSLRSRSRAPEAPALGGGSRHRPVVLATLAVPFEAEAARIAIQAAMEGSVKLIVVDAVEMPLWPQSMAMRYAELEELTLTARPSAGWSSRPPRLGIDVEHLRVAQPAPGRRRCSRSPASAMPGLLVMGPDPAHGCARAPSARPFSSIRKRCLVPVVGGGRGPVGPRPLRGQSPTAAALGCGVPISS